MSYVPESDIRVKCYDHSNFSRASVVQFRAFNELCPRIGHLGEKLWPFDFLVSFCCSISSVSIYYVPESDIRVKTYDHSNFSRASVVQFRASRYIMSLYQTYDWNVMSIWILGSFHCSILNVSIYYVPEMDIRVKTYNHSNFSIASVVQFWASGWVMSLNRTSEWNVMTIRISRELPLLNFEHLNEWCPRIGHPGVNLWPFEFLESFRCSISSILIYYVPESNIRVKCYDHSNFSRASVVQFRASWWVRSPIRTFVWKVMTIQICRELPLNSFERLDILYPRIEHPSEMLWPFEYLESFRC